MKKHHGRAGDGRHRIAINIHRPSGHAARSLHTADFVLGYVLSGTKTLCDNTATRHFDCGEMFCFGPGDYQAGERGDGERPYMEIVFAYSPSELRRMLRHIGSISSLVDENGEVDERQPGLDILCRCPDSLMLRGRVAGARCGIDLCSPSGRAVRGQILNVVCEMEECPEMCSADWENIKRYEILFMLVTHSLEALLASEKPRAKGCAEG